MIERNKEFEDDNGYKTTGRTGNRTDIRIVRPNFVRAEKNDCFCWESLRLCWRINKEIFNRKSLICTQQNQRFSQQSTFNFPEWSPGSRHYIPFAKGRKLFGNKRSSTWAGRSRNHHARLSGRKPVLSSKDNRHNPNRSIRPHYRAYLSIPRD